MSAAARERVVIATITRPHGLRGAVRAKVFNDETESLVPGARVWLVAKDGREREATVSNVSPAKETWIVSLEGVASIDEAEALRGTEIAVDRDALPPLEPGEYYHTDLVGCRVLNTRNESIGIVREVMRYPSVDALVVVRDAGGEFEVPMVEAIVSSLDVPALTIVIDTDLLEGD